MLVWLRWPPMYLVSSCFSKERGCLPLWGLILPFDQQIFIGDLHYTLETEKQTGLSPVQRGELGTNGLWGQFQATQKSQAVQAPVPPHHHHRVCGMKGPRQRLL